MNLGTDALFVFGSEHLFILNSTLAARRITGDLTCCDLVCSLGGDGVLVAGRNEAGVALQLFRAGAWVGKSFSLGDAKSPVVAMAEVSEVEAWCVCAGEQGASVLHAVTGPKSVRKSVVFEEKIFAVCNALWETNEVWLCASQRVLRVARDSMAVLGVVDLSVRAVLPIQVAEGSLMFGVAAGVACLYNSKGAEVRRCFSAAASDGDARADQLLDTSKALQVPGLPHLVVAWSQFGLCSWRLDTYGPGPRGFLMPLVRTERSSSKDGSQLSRVINRSNRSSSGEKESGGSNFRKSSLHLTRKALARAAVTCDETGKIISCNKGVQEVFGQEPSVLIGSSVRALFFLPRVKGKPKKKNCVVVVSCFNS